MAVVLTLKEGRIDFWNDRNRDAFRGSLADMFHGHLDINPYHYRNHLGDHDELKDVFDKIFEALNIDNFDESDIMTDYFHVGHYVNVNVGSFDKPFQVK